MQTWNAVATDEYVLPPGYTPYDQDQMCPAMGTATTDAGSSDSGKTVLYCRTDHTDSSAIVAGPSMAALVLLAFLL